MNEPTRQERDDMREWATRVVASRNSWAWQPFQADAVIRLLDALDTTERQLARYTRCPLGLDDNPLICSAGYCSVPECVKGQLHRAARVGVDTEEKPQ